MIVTKPRLRVLHRGQLFCKIFFLNDMVFRQSGLPHLLSPSIKFKSRLVIWPKKRPPRQMQARHKQCIN